MSRRPERGERLLRAAVFGGVGLGLALTAHWLGSAMLPRWEAIGLAGVAMATTGWWVSGRSRGMWFLVVLAVTSQLAMHAGFSWSMGGRGIGLLLCGSPHGDTAHLATTMLNGQVGHSAANNWSTLSLPMVTAHAIAAVFLGMWLRFGERALDQAVVAAAALYDTWLEVLFLGPALVTSHAHSRRQRVRAVPARRLKARVVGAIGLRGPPAVPLWG